MRSIKLVSAIIMSTAVLAWFTASCKTDSSEPEAEEDSEGLPSVAGFLDDTDADDTSTQDPTQIAGVNLLSQSVVVNKVVLDGTSYLLEKVTDVEVIGNQFTFNVDPDFFYIVSSDKFEGLVPPARLSDGEAFFGLVVNKFSNATAMVLRKLLEDPVGYKLIQDRTVDLPGLFNLGNISARANISDDAKLTTLAVRFAQSNSNAVNQLTELGITGEEISDIYSESLLSGFDGDRITEQFKEGSYSSELNTAKSTKGSKTKITESSAGQFQGEPNSTSVVFQEIAANEEEADDYGDELDAYVMSQELEETELQLDELDPASMNSALGVYWIKIQNLPPEDINQMAAGEEIENDVTNFSNVINASSADSSTGTSQSSGGESLEDYIVNQYEDICEIEPDNPECVADYVNSEYGTSSSDPEIDEGTGTSTATATGTGTSTSTETETSTATGTGTSTVTGTETATDTDTSTVIETDTGTGTETAPP